MLRQHLRRFEERQIFGKRKKFLFIRNEISGIRAMKNNQLSQPFPKFFRATKLKLIKMTSRVILKVYPTSEELSEVCSKVRCPEKNCEAMFQSTSNLNMHLIKHHKVANEGLTTKDETQYFCPTKSCPYHKDSVKHFTKLKYLKQHYLKVHAPKEFLCKKCNKKFSTESYKNSHMKNCGKIFACHCGYSYNSLEAILTHCKRKGNGHGIVKHCNKGGVDQKKKLPQIYDKNSKKTERLIYPKISGEMSFPIHYIAAVALSELSAPCHLSKVVDKSIQTDATEFVWKKGQKDNLSCVKVEKKRKYSQQTQTIPAKIKKVKISAQTQTNSDYLRHKLKCQMKNIPKRRKKSMETQTKNSFKSENATTDYKNPLNLNLQYILEMTKNNMNDTTNKSADKTVKTSNNNNNFCEDKTASKWYWDNSFFSQKDSSISTEDQTAEVKNELFKIDGDLNISNKEIDLQEFNDDSLKANTNQFMNTQVSDIQMFDLNRLCNIETQTELDPFLPECNDDMTLTLCSTTETQTTDDFDSLLYSNMYTQTCEEVDQLFYFNFADIETQTKWPDLGDCQDLG